MRKIFILLSFLFVQLVGMAQADRYWVGTSGGTWGISANWSLTSGGTGGASVPGTLQNAIFDTDATVTLDVNPSVNSLYIKQTSGSVATTVTFNSSATRTFTINSGTVPSPAFKVETNCVFNYAAHSSSTSNVFTLTGSGKGEVFGTFNVAGPTTAVTPRISFVSVNNLTIKNGGKLFFGANSSNPLSNGNQSYVLEAGSLMEVARNGFTLPDGNYDVNSLIRFTGFTTSGISSYGGFPAARMGNVEYNCPGQTSTVNMSFPTDYIIKGFFKVINTNGQKLRFATTLTGLTINGDLEISAPVSVSNSSTSIVAPNKSLTVGGNVTINPGGLFDLQENTGGGTTFTKLNGNLTIATGGTLTATGNGTTSTHELEFGGTGLQTVAVNGAITGIPLLKINGAGVVATTNLVLPANTGARLNLTSGNLDMGSQLLHIQNPSVVNGIVGGTVASHIIGRLRRATNSIASAYVFPVSKSAAEVATVKIYPTATGTDYMVEFFRPNTFPRTGAALPMGVASTTNYYWDIQRPSGTAPADVEFVYGGLLNNGGINAPADVVVLHWNGVSAWENMGRDNNSSTPTSVSVLGVNNFSPYALGSTSQLLPVHFVSLTGHFTGTANQIKWSVATDVKINGFNIERSTDGVWFSTIGYLPVGNATTTQFQYLDQNAATGAVYYRLQSVDINGKTTTSKTIYLKRNNNKENAIVGILPNPVQSNAVLLWQATTAGKLQVQVYNAAGKLMNSQQSWVNEGMNTLTLNVESLASGLYFINVYNPETGKIITGRFTK